LSERYSVGVGRGICGERPLEGAGGGRGKRGMGADLAESVGFCRMLPCAGWSGASRTRAGASRIREQGTSRRAQDARAGARLASELSRSSKGISKRISDGHLLL
jgi:hypothetical protein